MGVDVEPLFRYSRCVPRLEAALPQGATVTCMVVHAKFLAFGTSAGTVHIYELSGAPTGEWRKIQAHHARILDICLDGAGLQLATAAEDDTVVISAVFDDERSVHKHHAVRAVRVAPDYSRHPDKPFITGGASGHLWMVKRSPLSWLGGHVEKQIHESLGEGPTRAIAWSGPVVAWANNVCVRVYDLERASGVALIPAPRDALPQDVCPARLTWEGDSVLLVAWGSRVTVLTLREKYVPGVPDRGGDGTVPMVSRRYGETSAEFEMPDCFVCGLAPFGGELALLCYCLAEEDGATTDGAPSSSSSAAAPIIELRIVTRDNVGRVVHRDVLPLRGLKSVASPAAVSLVCDPENVTGQDNLPLLFAVAPLDVVVAQPRGAVDHVEWLVGKGELAEAVSIIVNCPELLPPAKRRVIIDAYIQSLVDSGAVGTACAACRELLSGTDAEAWDRWLQYAMSVCDAPGKSAFCAAVVEASAALPRAPIPAPARLRLPEESYEAVLLHFLRGGEVLPLLRAVRALSSPPGPALLKPSPSAVSPGESGLLSSVIPGMMMNVKERSAGLLDKARAAVSRGADVLSSVVTASGAGGADGSSSSSTGGGAGGAPAAGGAEEAAAPYTAPPLVGRLAPHLAARLEGAETAAAEEAAAAVAAAAAAAAAAESGAAPLFSIPRLCDAVRDALNAQLSGSGSGGGGGGGKRGPSPLPEGDLRVLVRVLFELYELGHRWEDAVRLCVDERVRLFALSPSTGSTAAAPTAPASATAAKEHSVAPLRPSRLFELIEAHGALPLVSERIMALMDVDAKSTLKLCGAHMGDALPPSLVVSQTRSRPEVLLSYLHHLFTHRLEAYNTQAYEPLHAMQLALYEAYDRPNLLAFLQRSHFYPLEDARVLCLSAAPKPLHRELVFVLSRMGSVKEAVALLVEQLRDVKGAIDVATSFEDEEVWAEVVARVVRTHDGQLVSTLLDLAPDTPLNPVGIIAAVPLAVHIPALATRLRIILADRGVSRSMMAAGKGLMQRDFMRLINRLIGGQRAGIAVPDEATCALCEDRIDKPKQVLPHAAGAAAAGGASGDEGRARRASSSAQDSAASAASSSSSSSSAAAPAAADGDAAGGTSGGGEAGESSSAPSSQTVTIVDQTIVVFVCRHAFHEPCLKTALTHGGDDSAGKASSSSLSASGRKRSSSAIPRRTGSIEREGGGREGEGGLRGGRRYVRTCPLCAGRSTD